MTSSEDGSFKLPSVASILSVCSLASSSFSLPRRSIDVIGSLAGNTEPQAVNLREGEVSGKFLHCLCLRSHYGWLCPSIKVTLPDRQFIACNSFSFPLWFPDPSLTPTEPAVPQSSLLNDSGCQSVVSFHILLMLLHWNLPQSPLWKAFSWEVLSNAVNKSQWWWWFLTSLWRLWRWSIVWCQSQL